MRTGTQLPFTKPDARERARLELVALAAELSTLATRIQEEAVHRLDAGELDVVLGEAEALHAKAWEVLAIESPVDRIDVSQLQVWMATFSGYLCQAAMLRARARPPRRSRAHSARS